MSDPWEDFQPADDGPWTDFSPAEQKPSPQGPRPGLGERFAAGLTDPIHGGAQMLESAVRGIAPGAVDAINRANNWLAQYGIVGRLPEGGVQQQQREREQRLRTDGVDWARLGGNVLSPANMAVAAAAPARAAGLAGRVATGGGLGALSAGLMPTASADPMARLAQMGVGGAGGAAVPALMAGLGRVVSPNASTNPQLALLQREGITPTIGQTLGGAANRAEQKAASLPIVGDAIRSARARASSEQLNAAVANRAMEPIGQRIPAGTTGRDAVAAVRTSLQDAYDDLLPRMTARADQPFMAQVSGVRQMVQTGAIDPNAARAFERILQNDVLGKFRGQGAMTGQTLKQVESDLTQQISRMSASTDADQRLVGDALREVQDALRSMLQRSNPQHAEQLRQINTGWANFKRLEKAAGYVGAEDGAFNASQLQSAVKALDRSKDKGRFARGDALMQDLSDAAKARLGDTVPNSGTADRMWLGAGGLAAGALHPGIPAALIGGAGLYSPPAQALLRGLVTARPQAAQPMRGLLNRTSPVLSPVGGLLALQGLE